MLGYDVKGSTHGRAASEKEKAKGVHAIHKDLDLINNERFLCLGSHSQKEELIHILSHDVQWLQTHSLMDYSFLIGFVSGNEESTPISSSKDRFTIKSLPLIDERFTSAYVGIIDILTEYQLKKKIETFVTGTLLLQPGISCQPPEKYAQRMIEFVESIILVISDADESGNSVVDIEVLKAIRQDRKKYLEEYVERNSKGLDWLKETTAELTEKAQLTLLSEFEKIKDLMEHKEEESNMEPDAV